MLLAEAFSALLEAVDFLGAALARFEITFLVTTFERGVDLTDDERVVLVALGILVSLFSVSNLLFIFWQISVLIKLNE